MQRDKKFADARAVMKRIGARLVRERKLALAEGDSKDDTGNARESAKDLLSLLVKANMTDPEGSSMSDEDVQDREPKPSQSKFSSLTITSLTLYLSSIQKSLPLSSPVTRRAARGSLGVFIVYPTTLGCRSVYAMKFVSSVPIPRIWNR
jgi:hypothetical protein